MSRVRRFMAAVMASCLLPLALASAEPLDIRVDLNGNAATPTNWNVIADPSNTTTIYSLIDFHTGLATDGLTMQITNDFGDSAGNNPLGISWSNPSAPWVDVNVLADYAFLAENQQSGQITLRGLDPANLYQLELLAVRHPAATIAVARYTVNGVAGAGIDGGNTNAWHAGVDGFTGQNLMRWDAVMPYADGTVLIDVTTTGNYAYFNGFRLSAVPEPGSLGLLIGGAMLLPGLVWQRRFSRVRVTPPKG